MDIFKNCVNDYFCNRLYCVVSNYSSSGRKVRRTWNDQRCGRFLLGTDKGRSMEGALVKSTKFLAILFLVLAAVLNLKVFN